VSRYQKGKTNLDFTEARDSEWQWHQLGRMQVCTSIQTDNHASTPPLSFFTGQMPFLPPNQQRQGTEGSKALKAVYYYYYYYYKYGRPPLLNNKCLDDEISTHMHAHTQPFNSPLSESTKVSWYQKKHSGFY